MFQDFEDPKDVKNTGKHVKLLRRAMAEGGLMPLSCRARMRFKASMCPQQTNG